MNPRPTVIVADDHPLFRRGLVDVLTQGGTIDVVGEASDGPQALALVAAHRPSLAILDVDMPGMSGLDVAAAIRTAQPDVKVVLLTMHKSRAMLDGALAAGVRGYVLKENAAADILACLHLIAEGGMYVSPGIAREPATPGAPASPGADLLAGLTPAEREVLRRVANGMSTRAIAADLGIKPKTVEHHRTHICVKLGITGINALVRFAAEHRAHIT